MAIYFSFTPTMMRDVAYRMLTSEQQAALHCSLAAQIERIFPDRLKQFAQDLAFHWLRGGNLEKTRPHLREAARQALDFGSPQDAEALLRWVLKPTGGAIHTEAGPLAEADKLALQQEGMLLELGGQACRLMGDYPRSDAYFQDYARIARLVGNQTWIIAALHQLAINAIEQGLPGQAESLVAEARSHQPLPPKLDALLSLADGLIKLRTGRLNEALAQYQEVAARGELEKQSPKIVGDACNNAGLACWHLGNLTQAEQSFSRALEIWRRAGNLFGQIATLSNLGIIAEKLGAFGKALGIYEQALKLADQLGYLHGISAIEANRANLSLLLRSWGTAQAQSARSLHFARLIGHTHSIGIALENLGLALGGLGLVDDALKRLDEAIALGEQSGDPSRRDSARLARAGVLLAHNRMGAAGEALADLTQQVGPELACWHDLLSRAWQSLSQEDPMALLRDCDLEGIKKNATTEDYLRTLDILAYVTGRLGPPELHAKYLAQRDREIMMLNKDN